MLSSWQSKNDVCTHVLEDNHQLIFIASRKEMEHREASVTVRRRGQHSQVSLQVRLIHSNSGLLLIRPRCQ
jgi:head-tail adaptor